MITPKVPIRTEFVKPPVGSGSSDATNIAAAMTAAGANGVVELRPGTYVVNARITASLANQTIVIPAGATLKAASGLNDSVIQLSASGVTLRGPGTIDGNRANQTSGAGVFISGANCTVEDVTITSTYDAGVRVVGSSGALATNTRIHNVRTTDCRTHHIQLNNYAPYGQITNCRCTSFANVTSNGIWCGNNSTDLVIAHNQIDGCGRIGIEIWGGCERSVVTGNIINLPSTNVGMGISADNSSYSVISNNIVVLDTAATGSFCGIELPGSDHSRTVGNLVKGPFSIGISIDGSENTITEGNTVIASKSYGVQVVDGGSGFGVPTKTTIANNSFTSVGQRAIFVNGTGVDKTLITGNRFHGTVNTDVYLFGGDYSAIVGNLFDSSTDCITLHGSDRFVISGNRFTGVGTNTAINCNVASGGVVTGNEFYNLSRAIFLLGTATYTFDNIAISGNNFVTVTTPLATSLSGGAVMGSAIRTSGNIGLSDYLDFGSKIGFLSGTGSPESVVTAGVGSIFRRTDGGASTTLYIKESGTGNTGWVAK